MKNITLSAEERLIAAARAKAERRRTTLNAEFRRWLASYAGTDDDAARRRAAYARLMASLDDVRSDGPYSRDEANERGGHHR